MVTVTQHAIGVFANKHQRDQRCVQQVNEHGPSLQWGKNIQYDGYDYLQSKEQAPCPSDATGINLEVGRD